MKVIIAVMKQLLQLRKKMQPAIARAVRSYYNGSRDWITKQSTKTNNQSITLKTIELRAISIAAQMVKQVQNTELRRALFDVMTEQKMGREPNFPPLPLPLIFCLAETPATQATTAITDEVPSHLRSPLSLKMR